MNAASVGIACCDAINRGAVHADGKIVYNLLDGHTVAVDAITGRELWKTQIADLGVGDGRREEFQHNELRRLPRRRGDRLGGAEPRGWPRPAYGGVLSTGAIWKTISEIRAQPGPVTVPTESWK